MVLLAACAHQEGFFRIGSRPQRNNNPLDLIYGNEAIRFGAERSDGRFAVFPDIDTGWNAGRRWLSIPATFTPHEVPEHYFDPVLKSTLLSGYLNASLAQVIYRFAPPSDGNNTEAYIKYVCEATGYERTTILTLDMLRVP